MDDECCEPFELAGTGAAVLLLHGFTSTPQSIRHVGHALHARTGCTVAAPLLAGHGTSPEDLARTTHRDWIASAETALRELERKADRVIIAGLSLGGTLALNLAIRHPDRIAAVATINGSTGIYRPEQARAVFDAPFGSYCTGIGSDIRHPGRHEVCYDRIPTSTLHERFLLTTATGLMLPLLQQPLLIIQSRVDHVVEPTNAHRIARDSGSASITMRWLDNSYHVATLDYDREMIVEELARFAASI
ncbi:alpha/beta hydrolase [Limimaricola variabilis]